MTTINPSATSGTPAQVQKNPAKASDDNRTQDAPLKAEKEAVIVDVEQALQSSDVDTDVKSQVKNDLSSQAAQDIAKNIQNFLGGSSLSIGNSNPSALGALLA